MRAPYILILILCAVPLCSQALSREQAEELVAQGTSSYAEGDYKRALQLFDSVNTTWSSAGLLFNIGNCHFRSGDVPRAILHYERALRLAPADDDIQENLDHARQQVVDRLNELPGFTLGATWSKLQGGTDIDAWARRSLWGVYGFFIVLAAALLVQGRGLRGALFALGGLLLIFTVVSVTFAAVRSSALQDDSAAIILAPKVDVLGEPRNGATVLFMLHKGTKVQVLQDRDTWYEVRLPNGNVGWMPAASLERI